VGPQAGHNLEHGGPPRVQESRRRGAFPGSGAGITTGRQESRTSPPACQAGRLSRDNATARRSTAPTNCRLLQHFADDLPRRLRRQATGRGANLVAVALAAGCSFELVWLRLGSRDDERRRKNQKAAPRLLCPVCPARLARAARPEFRIPDAGQGVLAFAGGDA